MSTEDGNSRTDPPATVLVATAADEAGAPVALATDERVVVGRAPDAGKARDGGTARAVAVEGASVSASHLAAWREGGDVCLRDLGSRNGSWLRLPGHEVVRVDGRRPISVWLGMPVAAARPDSEPDDARWSGEADYAAGIARAVAAWLERRRIAARVDVVARAADPAAAPPGQIPLADGHDLVVAPTGTVEIDWTQALAALWRWVGRQNRVFDSERSARAEGMILASDALRQAHQLVVEAAARGTRILLLGPSGAGKEELARCYHRQSGRSGPFVARNCAMFNKEFLRSELFGAEPGAFTGATHRITGAVERAHGGTLFLDEIGDMPLEVQPMLLRFLDRGEYERVGAYGQPRSADVRLVCATNKDLRAASLAGDFRADLWFRLSIQVVEVAPLRERPADLIAFLERRELSPGLSAWEALAADARPLVVGHRWDGNFRELGNFVERLPRAERAGAVDAATCRRALELGALAPPPRRPVAPAAAPSDERWTAIAAEALAAFAADFDQAAPASWDEVKDYVEKYLKPLVFAQLAGLTPDTARDDVDVNAVARRLDADRGTVGKQLARFLERFGRSGGSRSG